MIIRAMGRADSTIIPLREVNIFFREKKES